MSAGQGETKAYTIDDIAKELGVSKTTVSRAISGKGRLSAETRARVLTFIEAHNYRPNAVAKSLAQSRTCNLGMVLPSNIDLSFFQECMAGICGVASRNDYDVLVSVVNGKDTSQLERIIDNHKVDGVIVSRSTVNAPEVELLKKKQVPFVVIGTTTDPELVTVDNDTCRACKELTALLLGKGLRRMTLLGGEETHYVTESRRQGFEDAHRQAGVAVPQERIFLGINTIERARNAVERALEARSDCIICMDDTICVLALRHLRERGIRIPEEIQVASFYDSALMEYNLPQITSLRFNARELGEAVCAELLRMLRGEKSQGQVLPGYELVIRDSTGGQALGKRGLL